MARLSELFSKCIVEAMDAAKGIAVPVDKAKAYADIAKAIAMTGSIKTGDVSGDTAPATATKGDIAPDAAKAESKSDVKKPVAPKAGAKAPSKEPDPAPAEENDDEEWTARMQEKYAPQMKKFEEFMETYGEENIKACVAAFSEGNFKELTDITPLNINAFVLYLESLQEQQEE